MSAEGQSAREAILAAVRAARPPAVPAPEPLQPSAATDAASRRDAFVAALTAAGAEVVRCAPGDVARVVGATVGNATSVLSYFSEIPSTISSQGDPRVLDTLDVLLCTSSLGVAENGAVWIATSDSVLRAALFLAARVVLVVSDADLVDDLHAAYERIDVRAHGYGVFVAGPSKTADIEQALVIGAHGPKALTLVLVGAGVSEGGA